MSCCFPRANAQLAVCKGGQARTFRVPPGSGEALVAGARSDAGAGRHLKLGAGADEGGASGAPFGVAHHWAYEDLPGGHAWCWRRGAPGS